MTSVFRQLNYLDEQSNPSSQGSLHKYIGNPEQYILYS